MVQESILRRLAIFILILGILDAPSISVRAYHVSFLTLRCAREVMGMQRRASAPPLAVRVRLWV